MQNLLSVLNKNYMTGLEKYFGGTGITLEKLKEVMPTINVDGTSYKIENWLNECIKFDKLVPNKSKVWIPYSVWEYNIVSEVIWDKYQFEGYSFPDECKDWWVSVPYCKVNGKNAEGVYNVYEISFYKNWKRKSQMKHLIVQSDKPKRKFLSSKDIAELKKQEVISNSNSKR